MFKLHIWHRYVGVLSAILVIILSVTGLFLNFTDQLELDAKHIANRWLLERYRIGQFEVTSFQTEQHLVSHASNYVFLDGKYMLNSSKSLVGVIETDQHLVLATQASLLLLTPAGDLVDEISELTGLPEAPLGIAKDQQGHPVLRGINTYWKGSAELSAWQPLQGPHPKWVAPITTPGEIDSAVQAYVRSHEITLERMLLDLHSGRLLGSVGQNIMSLAAILFILLAISGTIIWLRKSTN